MLGTHGVPAGYGGFETAVEQVARYLVARGWRVVVYCQTYGRGPITADLWEGIERILVPTTLPSWLGTSWFDWRATRHAARFDDLVAVFGYNTAIFNLLQKARRTPLVFNMDGIEWSRARWGLPQKTILYVNERVADVIGDHLIADHPEIEKYLRTRAPAERITRIAYGAPSITEAPDWPVTELGLEPGRFSTLICRPVPENSILELVSGFSRRRRGHKLVVVGDYDGQADEYHAQVLAAASDEVVFAGSIYEPERVGSLRFHSAMYLHGHTVGGTNPSLVEALGAGNPVLAHDNPYNRWTAGDQVYFRTADDVEAHLDRLLDDPAELARLSQAARDRHAAEFTWEHVAGQYEALLRQHLPNPKR
jgi:glycosyltransferase involved in cell wall biosynthesis